MTVSYADDLQVALQLADAADRLTMSRYRASDLNVETKPDLTPVTESDKAVELALRDLLAKLRPGDQIVGEEFGGTYASDDPGRVWVIDPIDGTKSYVRGMDTWTTLVALMQDGEVKVGVVSMPALTRRWWATRGGGAFADGRRIHVSKISELANAQLTWSGVEEWDAIGRFDALVGLARSCWRSRGVGDAWQYMLVAEGAAEIATDPEATLWDLAAPSIVVQEAGGTFTGLNGVAGAAAGSGLATNGLLHQAALDYLGQPN
ncbi:MAG: inositol monophosphatase family protein [Solirubrobacteraceae bacterium]